MLVFLAYPRGAGAAPYIRLHYRRRFWWTWVHCLWPALVSARNSRRGPFPVGPFPAADCPTPPPALAGSAILAKTQKPICPVGVLSYCLRGHPAGGGCMVWPFGRSAKKKNAIGSADTASIKTFVLGAAWPEECREAARWIPVRNFEVFSAKPVLLPLHFRLAKARFLFQK